MGIKKREAEKKTAKIDQSEKTHETVDFRKMLFSSQQGA